MFDCFEEESHGMAAFLVKKGRKRKVLFLVSVSDNYEFSWSTNIKDALRFRCNSRLYQDIRWVVRQEKIVCGLMYDFGLGRLEKEEKKNEKHGIIGWFMKN